MWTEGDVKEKLREVYDPEIGLDIVSLGLVYAIQIEEQNIKLQMTLTSPMCPLGPQIMSAAHVKISELPMVKDIKIDLVWNPPWDPRTMASDEARIEMGLE